MISLRSFCLFALLCAPAFAADPAPSPAPTTDSPAPSGAEAKLALSDGERLTFRVGFGIFLHAGDIKISARHETNDGKEQVVVSTTTETRGILRSLFPFKASGESVFDPATGRLQIHTETSASSKKKTNLALEFDYATSTAGFTDFTNSAKNRRISFPPGSPNDLITSLVQTRHWNLKPGESRDIDVIFEDEIYQLTVHALRYEEIRTRRGKFNTLVYEPRMEKTPPKGMFKRGSAVHVWISQDELRLPVKFEVEFKFGAGVATLADYQPPTSANAAPADAAAKANE